MSAGSHRKIVEARAEGTGGRYDGLGFFETTVDIDRIVSVTTQGMEGELFFALGMDTGKIIWAKMDDKGLALKEELLGAER